MNEGAARRRPFSGPLFVVGSPRSGTSLLRLALTCHTRIVIPPECGFVVWLEPRFGDWSSGDCDPGGRAASFVADLLASRKFETWRLDGEAIAAAVAESRPRDYAELCAAVYRRFAREAGKPDAVWGDKNNFYLRHLPRLAERFPAAKFLHIVRDGRDVACSYREVMSGGFTSPYAPILPVEIEAIAREWSSGVLEAAEFLARASRERAMTLRYEDLVASPREVLDRVCAWMGLEFEPAMLDFHLENERSGLEPEATRGWKTKTFEPIDAGSVGRHGRQLARAEREAFERVGAVALARFGYR